MAASIRMMSWSSCLTSPATPRARRSADHTDHRGPFHHQPQAMDRYWAAYTAHGEGDGTETYPLRASLSGVPPCYVAAAECDVLHDENLLLRDRLCAAGVATTFSVVPGVTHGFLSYGRMLPQANTTLKSAAIWARGLYQRPTPG